MTTHEDMSEMKVRVNILEIAHIDNTNKISTLVDGFNLLNINLTVLIASINTAVKTALIGATFAATVIGGFWGYNTYITNQLNKTIPLQSIEYHK
jgi:hypothetical protein